MMKRLIILEMIKYKNDGNEKMYDAVVFRSITSHLFKQSDNG